MSEELVHKVNELSAEQEQDDGTLLTATEEGDRKLIFKRDLKVEFSNNTTQVMDVITVTLTVKKRSKFRGVTTGPTQSDGAAKLRLFSQVSEKTTLFLHF